MNILLLGNGGRESAIGWKLAQSKKIQNLFIAPGNAGTSLIGNNVNISAVDFEAIKVFVLNNSVDMVVVGPEEPLVRGIYDFFGNDPLLKNIPVIGPSKLGAKLEGSKDFAKQFMMRHNIPTARYRSFTLGELDEAFIFLEQLNAPYVLKADGLAAGKGVLIVDDLLMAKKELKAMLEGRFGDAGRKVIIEEFLSGIECSVFVLTDGISYKILPVAKDYKRVGVGDTGPNTGGMGAVSPVPFADDVFMEKVERKIVIPTIDGLRKDKIDYKGFIFIGLINIDGEPFVIEYNVRMGDPETEVVMPRIKSDFVDLLVGVANGSLNSETLVIDPRFCSTVMLVSGGYPGEYEKGLVINGLDDVRNCLLFHAGTKLVGDAVVTDGGRVIAITSCGNTLEEALDSSFYNASVIDFDKKFYRNDIGFDLN